MIDPPPPPTATPVGTTVVGVDVGGTKVLGVAGPDGTVPEALERAEVPTGDGEVIGSIMAVVDELVGRSGHTAPSAIGVGLAGFISLSGVAMQSANVPRVIGVDVAGLLRQRYGVPVVVDNDANCVARAAARIDAPGARHVVAVTLGTGIGGGLVVDGSLVRGAHGFAGEPGHMIVDAGGPRCPCGQRGCWEVFASGSGLTRLAREAAGDGRAPRLLAAAGGDVDAVDSMLVGRLLAEGDPGAAAIFDTFAEWIALGLVNLVNLLDPEVVIIAGGLVREGEELLGRVRAAVAGYPTFAGGRSVDIRAATVGHLAGAIGARIAAADLVAGR